MIATKTAGGNLMSELTYIERRQHLDLMHSFMYAYFDQSDVLPWGATLWRGKWPELSDFLKRRDLHTYSKTNEAFEKVMGQRRDIQTTYKGMTKAFYQYQKQNATIYGLKPPPVKRNFGVIALVVILIPIMAYIAYTFTGS